MSKYKRIAVGKEFKVSPALLKNGRQIRLKNRRVYLGRADDDWLIAMKKLCDNKKTVLYTYVPISDEAFRALLVLAQSFLTEGNR